MFFQKQFSRFKVENEGSSFKYIGRSQPEPRRRLQATRCPVHWHQFCPGFGLLSQSQQGPGVDRTWEDIFILIHLKELEAVNKGINLLVSTGRDKILELA